MLSNRVGRFFTWVLSIVAVVIVLAIFTGIAGEIVENFDSMGIIMAVLGAALVAFMHQLSDDLLNFSFMDNIVFKTIKRVLFYGALGVCVLLGYTLFYENGGGRVPGEVLEEVFYCMMLPAPFAAAVLCIWADANEWEKERIPFLGYFSLIPSFVIGLLIAILGPEFYAAGGIIVILLGLGAIVFLTFKFGFIYSEGEGYNPFKKKKKKGNQQSKGKMPPELFNKLYDELQAIANRYSGTKYLGYGIKAKVSGYGLLYDESATIYADIDIYLGGCTATSEWQIKSASNEATAYQEAQMKKMYNDLVSVVNRLLPQYNYYFDFKYGVKPGHRDVHESY